MGRGDSPAVRIELELDDAIKRGCPSDRIGGGLTECGGRDGVGEQLGDGGGDGGGVVGRDEARPTRLDHATHAGDIADDDRGRHGEGLEDGLGVPFKGRRLRVDGAAAHASEEFGVRQARLEGGPHAQRCGQGTEGGLLRAFADDAQSGGA